MVRSLVSVEDTCGEARGRRRHLLSVCPDDNWYTFLSLNFVSGGYEVFEIYLQDLRNPEKLMQRHLLPAALQVGNRGTS